MMKINAVETNRFIKVDYFTEDEFRIKNKAGSLTSTTVICNNKLQDHGLFICQLDKTKSQYHILLSSLEESVCLFNHKYNLGAYRMNYGYNYSGIKHISEVDKGIVPSITYNAGPFILRKELLLTENEAQLLIKYTLINSGDPVILKLKPFLAFRDIKSLSKATSAITIPLANVTNGIKSKMYPNYPYLYLQTSNKPEIADNPEWYYNFTYKANYAGETPAEDLFVPCTFSIKLLDNESLIFSAALADQPIESLQLLFEKEKIKLLSKACLKSYYQ